MVHHAIVAESHCSYAGSLIWIFNVYLSFAKRETKQTTTTPEFMIGIREVVRFDLDVSESCGRQQ